MLSSTLIASSIVDIKAFDVFALNVFRTCRADVSSIFHRRLAAGSRVEAHDHSFSSTPFTHRADLP